MAYTRNRAVGGYKNKGESGATPVDKAEFEKFDSALYELKTQTFNVKDYGAKGDSNGTNGNGTDDTSAIVASYQALAAAGTGVLYFPPGIYRYAQQTPADGAGLLLNGLSNVAVVFAHGATLFMDNLSAGSGTSHGILVKGSGSNIWLVNPRVVWSGTSARSLGDGIRCIGYPSDSAPAGGWVGSSGKLSKVHVLNPVVENAPQTGMVFLGCSDVTVEGSTVDSTKADALHFNACRRVRVTGHEAINSGDDGLAFVTYYDAAAVWQNATQGPFNQPSLGGWSNFDSSATGIVVDGGNSNGVRVAGCLDVSITDYSVANKTAQQGVILDSGTAGGSFSWTYQASRGIRIHGGGVDNCAVGALVRTFNVDRTADAGYWQFDVSISDLTIRGCSAQSVLCAGNGSANSGPSGVSFDGVRASGAPCYFNNLRDSSVTNVDCDGQIQFAGNAAVVSPLASQTRNNMKIDNVRSNGSSISFQDLRGATVGKLVSHQSAADGVLFTRCTDITFERAAVVLPNRGNTGTVRAALFSKCQRVEGKVVVDTDSNNGGTWRSVEIGGGDATDVSDDIHVDAVYRNTLNQTGHDIVIQAGGFGPTNYHLNMRYKNGGEASPIWRYYLHGDDPRGTTTNRPANPAVGDIYFNTTTGSSEIWDGATWQNVPLPIPPLVYLRSGSYSFLSPAAPTTSAALANGNLRLHPLVIAKPTTLSRVGMEIVTGTTADAGSTFKIAIYSDSGSFAPSAVLFDSSATGSASTVLGNGLIAADNVSTQEITVNWTLQPGLYWVGAVLQGVVTTQPTVRTLSTTTPNFSLPVSTTLPAAGAASPEGYSQSGVTGALPAFTSTATSTLMPRVFAKVA